MNPARLRPAFGALAGVAMATAASAQETITVGSYGGAWGDAFKAAALDPIAEELGITIKSVAYSSLSEVKLQVDAGAVEVDVANLGGPDCVFGSPQGLFEPLDYDVIDASNVPEALVHTDYIGGATYYSTVLAYRTDAFPDNPPQSWNDFWDTEKFPGTRAMWNFPVAMLEIALIADGVEGEALYPLDIERAIAKLEKIKPDITVWWTNGGQAAQLLADGEVDMLAIWNGRASTVIKDGTPAAVTYNQGVLGVDCLAVPKGSEHAATAMKVIDRILDPDIQANFPRYIDYGPVNPKAFEGDLIDAALKDSVNSSPANIARQVLLNDEWWGQNMGDAQAAWDKMMQE